MEIINRAERDSYYKSVSANYDFKTDKIQYPCPKDMELH